MKPPPPQDLPGDAEGWLPAALAGFGADGRQPPDLLILLFGMNQSGYPVAADIAALDRVSAEVAACDPPPDLLYVANATPSSHSRTRGHRAAIEARDSYAGLIRARAAMEDRGLIDLGRALDMAHWGYDPGQVHF